MRRDQRQGLTLVEVLAAVTLLSVVAAACISILRDATGAAATIPLEAEARQVLSAWSIRTTVEQPGEQSPVPWTWTAPSGNEWSIAEIDDIALPPPPTKSATDGELTPDAPTLDVTWRPITLVCSGCPGETWTFWRLGAPAEGQSP